MVCKSVIYKMRGSFCHKKQKVVKKFLLKKLVYKNIETKNDFLRSAVSYVTWCFCLVTRWQSRFIGTLPDSQCVGSAALWMYFSQQLAR